MGIVVQNTFTEILILATSVLILVIIYFHNVYTYWAKRGVPTVPSRFPLGNSNILLPKGFIMGVVSKTYYDHLKRNGHKFGGIYLVTEPNLVIVDPELIKDILSKDFQHFVDRGFYFNEKDDPISANLFAVDGIQWKELRVKLTPTFTSCKIRMMFQTVIRCSENMLEEFAKNINVDVDIKEVMGRFTTDVIGSCAFGIECNSFKNPEAEFRRMGKRIFYFDFWRSVRAFLIVNLPKFSHILRLTSNNKEVCDFFINLVANTIKLRKETKTKRNDFLQLLIDLGDSMNFGLNETAAQVFLFFVAGFESSATVMTLALYELARNPDYQIQLRQEIKQVLAKHEGEITYDSLPEMKYLEQVFHETLRLYPPGTTLIRRCVKDYKLRDTNIVIEKGIPVLISPFGLHRDPEYYPEPEKFDPERFSEDQKKQRSPNVFLPFGGGPRNCIGGRFGTMQTKIGIISVIRNFQVSVSPEMKPVEFDQTYFSLRTVNKILLKFKRIE